MASGKRKTRSQVISFYLLDQEYREIEEGESDFGDRALPRGLSIVGRVLNLTKREKGKQCQVLVYISPTIHHLGRIPPLL